MEKDTVSMQETPALGLTHGHQAQCCCSRLVWQLPTCQRVPADTPSRGRAPASPHGSAARQGAELPTKGSPTQGPPALTSQLALPPLPHRCSRRVCGEKEQAEATL